MDHFFSINSVKARDIVRTLGNPRACACQGCPWLRHTAKCLCTYVRLRLSEAFGVQFNSLCCVVPYPSSLKKGGDQQSGFDPPPPIYPCQFVPQASEVSDQGRDGCGSLGLHVA